MPAWSQHTVNSELLRGHSCAERKSGPGARGAVAPFAVTLPHQHLPNEHHPDLTSFIIKTFFTLRLYTPANDPGRGTSVRAQRVVLPCYTPVLNSGFSGFQLIEARTPEG